MKIALSILLTSIVLLVGCMPSEAIHVRVDGSTSLSVSYTWLGAYNGATAYVVNDVVEYNGSSYVCISNSTGNLPTNETYFDLMASKGDTGAQGAQGAQGADGADGNTNVTTVLKTSDETVNNSNVLQDDDALTFTVVSGCYYNVWLFCKMTSPATPDFKFGWTVPGGSTMVELYNYSGGQIMGGSFDATTEHATNSSGAGYIWLTNTLYAGGDGPVTFKWCQNTANASDTKVLTGSYLIITKLN